MPFTFPDPSVTDVFTGDNGITYVWDADDSKWQIKGFAVEQREDFDPQLKGHVCAEFFEVVADYQTVEATKGHSMATYDFGEPGVKYWVKPPKADFFVNGESYYINEAGPFEIGTVDVSKQWVTFFIKGGPTPAVGDSCTFSKTRKLCTEVSFLQNEIIELEEEIDAIAPSVERGKWTFTATGTVAQPGQFTMYDADFGSGGPIGLFKSVKSIWFNEIDADGVSHGFADIDDGELLEIFVDGSPEFGLYEVKGKAHDETQGATSFWVVDVQFIRTNEDTTAVAPGELCRFKVFHAPSGGEAGDFVMKSGDTMTGQLKFYTEQADDSFDYRVPTNGSKDIRFTTKRLDTGFENTTSLYKPGYTDTLVCSGALMSKGSLYTSSYLYGIIFKNDGTRVTKAPRIYFNRTVDSNDNVTDEFGALRWNGTNILRWKDTEITIDKPINITNNALATDGQHAIHRGYVDKVARMAGLQLGRYLYRRNSDNWVAGSIKSNTSTNPAAITKLSIYKSNHDGITFGASFLANLIVPGMFLHFMEKQEGIYCGKITDVSIITNGVEVILEPFTSLISGGVYLNNPYDVLISYNRYGIKFPQ
jgi:hypothetical protein